jgi:tripartite-type tricarboxylate transporter receptor subunit TctC
VLSLFRRSRQANAVGWAKAQGTARFWQKAVRAVPTLSDAPHRPTAWARRKQGWRAPQSPRPPLPTLRRAPIRAKFALVAALLGAALLIASGDSACAQTRTIRIVDPSPPGGLDDLLARLLAEEIARAQGATVVVENRPGAASAIGTEAVARAAPDGATLLLNATPFVINPLLRKLNYDPLTSFTPICYLVNSPTVIAVNAASPYRTLADLITAARERPRELTLASIGPGSATHIAFEMLRRAANVDMTFVPYPGTAPAVTALLGGHVTSYFGIYSVVSEQVKAGRLRALATAAPTRIELLPDVPTVAEQGFPGYEVDIWFGVVAPARTPNATVTQLAAWFTAAMQAPDVKAKLVAQGMLSVAICGEEFGAHIRKQYEEFGRVIREANIKAE